MKRFLLLAFTLLFFTISGLNVFAQQPKTALELNNHLASITDSLYKKGQIWGNQLNNAADRHDFASLAPYRIKIQQFIDLKLAELKKMKDIGGSEEFRTAMIDFLVLEKQMIESSFIPFEKLPPDATNNQLKSAIDKLTDEAKNESKAIEKVNEIQDLYARKNGFAIESTQNK
jgi:hypothetical protein